MLAVRSRGEAWCKRRSAGEINEHTNTQITRPRAFLRVGHVVGVGREEREAQHSVEQEDREEEDEGLAELWEDLEGQFHLLAEPGRIRGEEEEPQKGPAPEGDARGEAGADDEAEKANAEEELVPEAAAPGVTAAACECVNVDP